MMVLSTAQARQVSNVGSVLPQNNESISVSGTFEYSTKRCGGYSVELWQESKEA